MLSLESVLAVVLIFFLIASIAMWISRLVVGCFGIDDEWGRKRAAYLQYWEHLLDAVIGLLLAVWCVQYIRDAPDTLRALVWAMVSLFFVAVACWNLHRWEKVEDTSD